MSSPRFALLTLGLLSFGCGGSPSTEPPPSVFIALQKDFADFESWEPFSWVEPDTGTTHAPGPRTVYLKQRPPKGSTTFPVGTVIVKTVKPDGGEEQIFAMTKRGGGFNENGATGWEWFELSRSDDNVPVIVWRGVGAPAGHRYSQVDTSCNTCHQSGSNNDFVLSPSLKLSDL